MGSVWLVSAGEDETYRIEGVYDSEELACRFAATLDSEDNVEVEEWPVNQHTDALMAGRVPFRVTGSLYHGDGSLILGAKAFDDEKWNEAVKEREQKYGRRLWTTYTVCVWAKTAKEALALAGEKIAQYKAATPPPTGSSAPD